MSRRPQSRTWVFVATHTTGLDENRHEIVDVAILDSDGKTLLHTAVLPKNLDTADADVLAFTGYNDGEWAPSPEFAALARSILGHLTGPVIVGHNTQLDMRFLNHLMRRAFVVEELEPEEIEGMLGRVDTRFIDTVTLAWEQLADLGGLKSLSLQDVCAYLRIHYKADSALSDARASRAVYEKLLRANAWQRWWWRWLAPKD